MDKDARSACSCGLYNAHLLQSTRNGCSAGHGGRPDVGCGEGLGGVLDLGQDLAGVVAAEHGQLVHRPVPAACHSAQECSSKSHIHSGQPRPASSLLSNTSTAAALHGAYFCDGIAPNDPFTSRETFSTSEDATDACHRVCAYQHSMLTSQCSATVGGATACTRRQGSGGGRPLDQQLKDRPQASRSRWAMLFK